MWQREAMHQEKEKEADMRKEPDLFVSQGTTFLRQA